jgi:hypothetical protein
MNANDKQGVNSLTSLKSANNSQMGEPSIDLTLTINRREV